MIDPDRLAWDKMDGLIPAIAQDRDGRVRMLGYVDRAALTRTIETGLVTFFSRSRGKLWTKGESSGNVLRLLGARADCDGDALLLTVEASGPTCHQGSRTCFGEEPGPFFPAALGTIVADRARADPQASYTARLLAEGVGRIAQKVGEEGVEVALAAVSGSDEALLAEAADLVFHLGVLLHARGRDWADVADVLERRHADKTATASS